MFKHVLKREESEGDESGSDVENLLEEQAGSDSGGSDADMADDAAGEDMPLFADDEDDEELPTNLPSVEGAATEPIFELSQDPKGRKTLVCCMCPDKVLRDGTMRSVHIESQSHKRRLERYAKYLKDNPAVGEQTVDPRRITAYIDTMLRIRKSGGAGFTIDPLHAKKRTRRGGKNRAKKTGKSDAKDSVDDTADSAKGDVAPTKASVMPEGDGITDLPGVKGLNAKEKRKMKQAENRKKGAAVRESGESAVSAVESQSGQPKKGGGQLMNGKKRKAGPDAGSKFNQKGAAKGQSKPTSKRIKAQ